MCMSYSSKFFENKPSSEAVSRRRTDNAKENGQFTPVFSGARVARSLVFCVMFCRSLLSFSFWLPLWYLGTFPFSPIKHYT